MASATVASSTCTKNGDDTETDKQLKERAERNRQKALLLKKSKVVTHPYKRYVIKYILCMYIKIMNI